MLYPHYVFFFFFPLKRGKLFNIIFYLIIFIDEKIRLFDKCRLEYPGVSPELSFLKDSGRAEFYTATDEEALDGTYVIKKKKKNI